MKQICKDKNSDCMIERVSYRFDQLPDLYSESCSGYNNVALWFDMEITVYVQKFSGGYDVEFMRDDIEVRGIRYDSFQMAYEHCKKKEGHMSGFNDFEIEFVEAYENYLVECILLGDAEDIM